MTARSAGAERTPQRAGTIVEGTVDDSTVLFARGGRRLHVLNESATALWHELGRSPTLGRVAATVAEAFGADVAAVRHDLGELIERFLADGLLVEEPRSEALDAASDRWLRPDPSKPGVPSSGSFEALDATLRIETDDTELATVLDTVLHPLLVDRPTIAAIRVAPAGADRWEVVSGSGRSVVVGSRLAVATRALAEVNAAAVASARDQLVLHAGAVAGDGGAVVLPAPANHGKSTLTVGLVRAGSGYLTDEAAAVSSDLIVRPFPKAPALDPGSFPVFPDLAPALRRGLAEALAETAWHPDPTLFGTVADPTPLRAVVFPRWSPGSPTRITGCDHLDCLSRLLGESFDFAAGGQVVFDILTGIVDAVPCYRLVYSELSEAVEIVGRLMA
ncbi:MAG: PqqD family peptide modification chaperone [Acidimicrobiales bacterium]